MRRSDCSEESWPVVTHPTSLTFFNFTTAARDRVLAILTRCTHLRKLEVRTGRYTDGSTLEPCPELLRAVAAMGDGLEELTLRGVCADVSHPTVDVGAQVVRQRRGWNVCLEASKY